MSTCFDNKMINIINKLRVPTLFTRSLYRVGDDSHSDFKKINKPAPDANINEGNVLQAIDNVIMMSRSGFTQTTSAYL